MTFEQRMHRASRSSTINAFFFDCVALGSGEGDGSCISGDASLSGGLFRGPVDDPGSCAVVAGGEGRSAMPSIDKSGELDAGILFKGRYEARGEVAAEDSEGFDSECGGCRRSAVWELNRLAFTNANSASRCLSKTSPARRFSSIMESSSSRILRVSRRISSCSWASTWGCWDKFDCASVSAENVD